MRFDPKQFARLWRPDAQEWVTKMRAEGVSEKEIEDFCWISGIGYVAPILVEDRLGEKAAKFAAGLN
jgi:hypothetical protein